MAEYAIGDLQGCLEPLQRLLDHLHFDEKCDRLWFVGDLVNRGPSSLEVLRFIKQLPLTPRIVLGNHDLHLLHVLEQPESLNQEDTFQDILNADDREELEQWLRMQSLLYHDKTLDVVMCHAGIYPHWTLDEAKKHAHTFETMLRSPEFKQPLSACYGNTPASWSDNLTTIEQLRVICNAFTRMRFCDEQGRLLFDDKGGLKNAATHHFPWYATPNRCIIKETIIFGHWAALKGHCPHPNIHAIDTGCVWGGPLTALRLGDMLRFSVPGV